MTLSLWSYIELVLICVGTASLAVGNDVRKAVADGYPVHDAVASDLRPGMRHRRTLNTIDKAATDIDLL